MKTPSRDELIEIDSHRVGTPRHLGVYVDAPYRITHSGCPTRIATDSAAFGFLVFAAHVGRHFDDVIYFGRHAQAPDSREFHELPLGPKFVPLPHYTSLRQGRAVISATLGTARGMWRGLSRVDVVWVFGPHPFALLLILLATIRRRRVVLGVRQDTIAYYRGRFPSSRWNAVMPLIRVLNWTFRRLGRRLRTTAVGADLAAHFRRGADVFPMTVSLIRARDIVSTPGRRSGPTVELLTVGRIEPEKNPLLLIEAMAGLERKAPGQFHLSWIGDGALGAVVRERAVELGVAKRIDFPGFIPVGPELLARYRSADIFVHVSLTEGVPQVLIEAMASGTPIVATDVGGVRELLESGAAGVLVPPRQPEALIGAIEKIALDHALGNRVASRALEVARTLTIESQARAVAHFLMRN